MSYDPIHDRYTPSKSQETALALSPTRQHSQSSTRSEHRSSETNGGSVGSGGGALSITDLVTAETAENDGIIETANATETTVQRPMQTTATTATTTVPTASKSTNIDSTANASTPSRGINSISHLIETPPPNTDANAGVNNDENDADAEGEADGEADGDNDGDDDYDETDINSTTMGDDEDYIAPSNRQKQNNHNRQRDYNGNHNTPRSSKRKAPSSASSTSISSTSSSKRKKKSNIANSKLSLKKGDGEPFWRKDIQYDLLQAIFDDKTACFTNSFPELNVPGANNSSKLTFAEIYVRTLAESSKSSKILKEKLLRDENLGKGVSKVCVLVNVGRMNTTINFVHDMKSTLRTYHSIPSLQTGPDGGTVYQLQDTPRLKSIIKAVCDEDEEGKFDSLEQLMELSTNGKRPNTNVAQVLFLLENANSGIPIIDNKDFHILDLFVNVKIDPKVRARQFLWLVYSHLETDFSSRELSENPFGIDGSFPKDVPIPDEDFANYDKDTDYEIQYADEMFKARMQYVSEDHSNDTPHRSVDRLGRLSLGLSLSLGLGLGLHLHLQLTGEKRAGSGSRKRAAAIAAATASSVAGDHDDSFLSDIEETDVKPKSEKTQTGKRRYRRNKGVEAEQKSAVSDTYLSTFLTSKNSKDTRNGSSANASYDLQFPMDGLSNLKNHFKKASYLPNEPLPTESIAHKCDLVEISRPIVYDVRTSSKASTASFNKKITILGNWIYRYFRYKRTIGNKLLGLEWEDIRHDMIKGTEKYLYENFGQSLTAKVGGGGVNENSRGATENEGVETENKFVPGTNTGDAVVFNFLSQGDFNKANERKAFELQLINFVNELFIKQLEKKEKQQRLKIGGVKNRISFDLDNETVLL